MRGVTLALLAAALAACDPGGTKVEHGTGMDLARFRRVGVLPFTDSRGQGWLVAAKLAQGLSRLDYNPVDLRQMESVFKSLKLEYSSGLSIQSLAEIHHVTLAEALVFGSIDSEWSEARILMIDTEIGEVILNARVRPRRGRSFRGPDEIVQEALGLFASLPARQAAPRIEEPALPLPE